MPRDRELDPITHDYVADGKGGRRTVTTAATQVQHQVLGEIDRWWGDPEAGSRVHEFERSGAGAADEQAIGDAIRGALERLERAGRIRNLVVTTTRSGSRIDARAEMVDVSTGEPFSVSLPAIGG